MEVLSQPDDRILQRRRRRKIEPFRPLIGQSSFEPGCLLF
jgi:hypothetical protein